MRADFLKFDSRWCSCPCAFRVATLACSAAKRLQTRKPDQLPCTGPGILPKPKLIVHHARRYMLRHPLQVGQKLVIRSAFLECCIGSVLICIVDMCVHIVCVGHDIVLLGGQLGFVALLYHA